MSRHFLNMTVVCISVSPTNLFALQDQGGHLVHICISGAWSVTKRCTFGEGTRCGGHEVTLSFISGIFHWFLIINKPSLVSRTQLNPFCMLSTASRILN